MAIFEEHLNICSLEGMSILPIVAHGGRTLETFILLLLEAAS